MASTATGGGDGFSAADQPNLDLPSASVRVPSMVGELAAEFLGTFILILLGVGVVAQVVAGGIGDHDSIAWSRPDFRRSQAHDSSLGGIGGGQPFVNCSNGPIGVGTRPLACRSTSAVGVW